MTTDRSHDRPDGAGDDAVAAVGQLTEALEWVERARGHLYEFHQMMGHADALLGEATDALDTAGHQELAQELGTNLVGRNALDGRWSFQMVEEFDDGYWSAFRDAEARVRDELLDGRRHVYESEMKDRRRGAGHLHHERRPATAHDPSITAVEDPSKDHPSG